MSERLDRHIQLERVAMDLHLKDVYDTGRQGLPAESVLRCALLKQFRRLSHQALAFHLSDSASFLAFVRLPGLPFPKKSVLQQTISLIQPATWERIYQRLPLVAKHEKVVLGKEVRIDSTPPKRISMHRVTALYYGTVSGSGHSAPARSGPVDVREAWHAEVKHYLPLIKQVIDSDTTPSIQYDSVPTVEKRTIPLRDQKSENNMLPDENGAQYDQAYTGAKAETTLVLKCPLRSVVWR